MVQKNKKDQTRLSMLVNEVAKATAYIWTSESEGIAKDFMFQRTASPALLPRVKKSRFNAVQKHIEPILNGFGIKTYA